MGVEHDANGTPLDNSDDTTTSNVTKLNLSSDLQNSEYKFEFVNSVTLNSDDASDTLTSNGNDIITSVNGNIITGTADGIKVFDIVIYQNTNDGGTDDSYVYTQYQNIDHPTANVDDTLTMEFGFKIKATNGDDESAVQNFTVTVNDSLPNAIDDTFDVNEDSSVNIVLTEEGFGSLTINNGNGADQTLTSTNSIDILDPNDTNIVIGQLTANDAGYVTFTPNPDYSNYASTPSFSYKVTDNDGDFAEGTINLDVNPIADKPTWSHDRVTTDEDTNVALGLKLPTLNDQTDVNSSTTGDNPERIGHIELSSVDKGAIIYNGNTALNDGSEKTSLSIVIVKYIDDGTGTITMVADTDIHYSNVILTNTDYKYLTQDEYEALEVAPNPESHKDIQMYLGASSYEVDDSGEKLIEVAGAYSQKTIRVEVEAVTDDITLKFDNKLNIDDVISDSSDTHPTSDTYTITNNLSEGGNVIDLKLILTSTTGGSDDMDGSEYRSYIISGVPEGTVVEFGDRSATADSSGNLTINASWYNDVNEDVAFTMTLPEHYSGDVNASITLSVKDNDWDSNVTPETKTETVYFNVDVDPVADKVTLNVSQARGLEDSGRDAGNTANDETADDINAKSGNEIPGAIDLDVNVTSDDTDGSETFTVIISDIPTDAIIFYNGDELSQTGTITITDFQNDIPLQVVPPHNSDADFDLSIKAYTVDTDGTTTVTSESIAQTLTMNVQVDGVSDIPVNNTLNIVTASNGHDYQFIVAEDMGNTQDGATIDFKDIYANTDLSSYDNDTSEALSIVVTGLKGEFNIEGATFMGGTGETRTWVFDAASVNDGSVKITTDKNYSGEIDLKVKYVTTEQEGDSATHDYEPVKILVTADTEATMTLKTEVIEDVASAVNFSVAGANGDTNESIQEVRINIDDVTNKEFTLLLNGNDISTAKVEGDYYVLIGADIGNVTVKYASDLGTATDASFSIKYTTIDSAAGIDDESNEISATYNLTLSAVTDAISIDATNINGTNVEVTSTTEETETISITNTGDFTVEVALNAVASDNGDTDTDGSEAVTRLVVENVPLGISVDGADFTQTGEGTNLWFIDVPNGQLDGSFSLTFQVNDALADGTDNVNTVKITAYNQDGVGSDITTAATEMVFVDNIPNSSGGTPSTVNASMELKAYDVVEDTQFSLADVVSITPDVSRNDEAYSISFTAMENVEVLDNPSLRTYEENDADGLGGTHTVYVLNIGTGDIQTALQSVKFLPELNFNDNNDGGEQVAIVATLTAYVPNTRIVDTDTETFVDANVTPITDAITSTAKVDTIVEDGVYNFDINLDTVDDPDYAIIGDVTVAHSGVSGTLTWDGGSVVFDGTTTTATIPSGKITGLEFTPLENEAGQTVLTYSATSQETGASNQETGGGIITLNITPVADGLTLDGLKANGTEFTDVDGTGAIGNEYIALTTNSGTVESATLIDSSESIQTILVDGVPDGFLVFTGTVGNEAMAQNAGVNATGDNTWNVKVDSDGTSPQIWIKAPINWSGDIAGLKLITLVKDGNSVTSAETTFNLHVDAIASSVTISPTKTFEDAYNWTDINLNANMTDLDGSETLSVTLAGQNGLTPLDSTALFALSDGTPISATFDEGTWTLTGIDSTQINNIQMMYHDYNGTVDVTANSVDGTSTGTIVSGSFDLDLDATSNIDLSAETRDLNIVGTSGNDTIVGGSGADTIDAGAGNDKIIFGDGDTIDGGDGTDTLVIDNDLILNFDEIPNSIDNIEKIELGSGNQNITLDLQDVLDMTGDSDNILEVSGDGDDKVTLDDSTGTWAKEDTSSKSGFNEYTATDGNGNDATIFIEIPIEQS